MRTPKSPKSPPMSPRSPRGGGGGAALLSEYDADGRLAARWRTADLLAGGAAAAAGGELPAPRGSKARGVAAALSAAFLPEGYPATVTRDYPEFIFWHAVQGLSSYIRGILSSHAVLRGVGAATALGAVFQFFVRDVTGMAGGIAFAAAGDFQAYSKQWRLFADVANDAAMAIDLASPLVPGAFLPLACLGSLARAMVGVAAGATHAALTQHFAGGGAGAGGAAADLTAKADSRERAINIVGSVVGMGVTHLIADRAGLAWLVFVVLTALHVWANVRAMRCLVLTSLNVPRIELLLASFVKRRCVLTPREMSAAESLLAPPFRALADAASRRGGRRLVFGARPSDALRAAAAAAAAAAPPRGGGGAPRRAAAARAGALLGAQRGGAAGEYFVALDPARGDVLVALAHGASEEVALTAYVHGLYLARHAGGGSGGGGGGAPGGAAQRLVAESEAWMGGAGGCGALLRGAEAAGWRAAGASLPRPAWTGKWA
ncbi:MAG: vitamin B6 photo-protection and homoeostasis-domain-containing protein [Monoraphidium minutum]|nr:MAG: vitamin B6 photo-protection and homoeostasis-domain-containing protein [Monoraphidium minutum]